MNLSLQQLRRELLGRNIGSKFREIPWARALAVYFYFQGQEVAAQAAWIIGERHWAGARTRESLIFYPLMLSSSVDDDVMRYTATLFRWIFFFFFFFLSFSTTTMLIGYRADVVGSSSASLRGSFHAGRRRSFVELGALSWLKIDDEGGVNYLMNRIFPLIVRREMCLLHKYIYPARWLEKLGQTGKLGWLLNSARIIAEIINFESKIVDSSEGIFIYWCE